MPLIRGCRSAFAAVEGVLEGIEKVSLQAVFLEWMDQLRKCIATNGEFTEEAQINVVEEWNFLLPILRCACPGGTPCIFIWLPPLSPFRISNKGP
jgi:hypothetical protein